MGFGRQVLNVAWAMHEITADWMNATLMWFDTRGQLDALDAAAAVAGACVSCRAAAGLGRGSLVRVRFTGGGTPESTDVPRSETIPLWHAQSSLQGEYRAGGRVHTPNGLPHPGCPIRGAPPAAPAKASLTHLPSWALALPLTGASPQGGRTYTMADWVTCGVVRGQGARRRAGLEVPAGWRGR